MVVAVSVIAIALASAWFVATLASRGDVEVRLGDDRFIAGKASDILDNIHEHDAPLGFNDPARMARPIWVDNGGDDPTVGWVAMSAYLPDDPTCLVQWNGEIERFVAECDDSITFPRSGAGLRQFPARVVEGRLEINLQDSPDEAGD